MVRRRLRAHVQKRVLRASCAYPRPIAAPDEREFAVADALGEAFREARGGFLAIGRDEFGERGEQAGLRQAVAVDTLDSGFGPGLVQIAERSPLLLMVRNVIRSLHRVRRHVHATLMATSPAAIPTRRQR